VTKMAWINDYQVWLTPSQSLQNAQQVVDFLYTPEKDWSKESISALIGNMNHESSINPNMYEYGYEWNDDRGFGLVQWTPRSKYWNWALQNGYSENELRNGDPQLARIDYEVENNIQWIPVNRINNLTFKEFRTNSRGISLNALTEAFTWGYERPNATAGAKSMADRQAFALRAYNELDWSTGESNPEPEPEPTPEPTPEPEITINFDTVKNFFQDFTDQLIESLHSMLIVDLFMYGKSDTIGNTFITIKKQLENTYKMQPTKDFDSMINDLTEEASNTLDNVLDNIVPEVSYPEPEPEPDPEPNPEPDPEPNTKVFPVKIQNGINFWKTSNYEAGSAQYDMSFGTRASGDFHAGYDVGGGGTTHTIYAIADGTVTNAGWVDGWGNRITIDHSNDDYHTLYAHLDSIAISNGDTIQAGQKIGIMGSSGGNYAIHLHVELSETGVFGDGNTVDPEPYLEVTGDNQTNLPKP